MLLKVVREGLGRAIAFGSFVFAPRRLQRSQEAQAQVNEEVKSLQVYQFYACPFCIKVRRALTRLNLPIETRNAQHGAYREELLAQGGEVKVPCLRIEEKGQVRWMFESSDIIAYLEQRFGAPA